MNTAIAIRTLDALACEQHVDRIVHGGATGADVLAQKWARLRGKPVMAYPANWSEFGKAAGPLRNRDMLRIERPGLVVAFPGGAGTADMVRAARQAGVAVHEVPARGAAE